MVVVVGYNNAQAHPSTHPQPLLGNNQSMKQSRDPFSQYLSILIVHRLLLAVHRVPLVLLPRVEGVHNDLFRALDLCSAERTALSEEYGNIVFSKGYFCTPPCSLCSPVPPSPLARHSNRACTTGGHRALSECPCRSPHRSCTAEMCFLQNKPNLNKYYSACAW